MDIGIDTESACEQIREELLELYDVIFCNIDVDPEDNACVIDAVIPKTNAEFSVRIHTDKTFDVVRVNPDAKSKATLAWAVTYLQDRGFTQRVGKP